MRGGGAFQSQVNIEAQLMTEGFRAELSVSGRLLTHVPTKTQFKGILESLPAINPESILLGYDPREMAILHVLNADCPPIQANDRIQDAEAYTQWSLVPPNPPQPPDPANPSAKAPAVWLVAKREDNPADVEVRFTLRKVTEKDAG